MHARRLLSVVGPTGVGKSDLAVDLAEMFGGEVISADSRQVYRGLDLGSGKITKEEMRGIPHHLLDVADVREEYTVAQFEKDARTAINDVSDRGKLPILCGGTGFWVDTVSRGLVIPEVPPNAKLRQKLSTLSNGELFALLEHKDPARAKTIDPHNPLRLIRALEIVEALGAVPKKTYKTPSCDLLTIGITAPKSIIDERIRLRIDRRLDLGMVDEVRQLLDSGVSSERLIGLGLEYRHITKFILGEYPTVGEMRNALAADTSKYAKRQMTWFKRHADIEWIGIGETTRAANIVRTWLACTCEK